MNNILSMQDKVKTYYKGDEDLETIKQINFLVDEIENISILGPSALGKQPMTNIIGCLDVLIHKPRGTSSTGFILGAGSTFGMEPVHILVTSSSLTHGEVVKKVSE